jgi:hypothetical protein
MVLALGCGSSSNSSGGAGSAPAATTSSSGASTPHTTSTPATTPIPTIKKPTKPLTKHQLAVRACRFVKESALHSHPATPGVKKALAQCRKVLK